MGKVFTELRALSALGTFLRSFTLHFVAPGHVRRLDAVNSRLMANLRYVSTLAGAPVLPDAGEVVYVDIDDTIRQAYGYSKQGAQYGCSKVKGLNATVLTATTPTGVPVILGARLRAWRRKRGRLSRGRSNPRCT